MTGKAITEAAAQAVQKAAGGELNELDSLRLATAALAAVTPLIEAAALERAAKLAEETARQQRLTTDYHAGARMAALSIAEDIRALKSEGRN